MRNAVKKIAMILIIVMLVNCFTGCNLGAVFNTLGYIFIGALSVAGIVGLIVGISDANRMMDREIRRTNPSLFENGEFNTTIMSLPEEELDSLSQTFYSLPERELNLFSGRLNSLPEEETISLMESLNSFSEEELAALVRHFNSMRETEIIYSLEHLNSIPETVSLTNFIQNIEFDVFGEVAYAGRK